MSKTLVFSYHSQLASYGKDITLAKQKTHVSDESPRKSQIIGTIAAALGIDKYKNSFEVFSKLSAKIKFASLDMSNKKSFISDFQVISSVKKAKIYGTYASRGMELKKGNFVNELREKEYFMNSFFLIAIESEDEQLIEDIHRAFKTPAYPLFVGRKNCVLATNTSSKIYLEPLITSLLKHKKELKKEAEILGLEPILNFSNQILYVDKVDFSEDIRVGDNDLTVIKLINRNDNYRLGTKKRSFSSRQDLAISVSEGV